MIIRKTFNFCGGHFVRRTSFSEKCSMSNHGHNFKVEVLLTSNFLDNGQMVVDFGFVKDLLNDFIDSFDHCTYLWNKENDEIKSFFKSYSKRWIELPVSPSAESLSILFFKVIDQIINNTIFNNNEKNISLDSIIIHETDTGYAQAFRNDSQIFDFNLDDIIFSDEIKNKWKKDWIYSLKNNIKFEGPVTIQNFDTNNKLTNCKF